MPAGISAFNMALAVPHLPSVKLLPSGRFCEASGLHRGFIPAEQSLILTRRRTMLHRSRGVGLLKGATWAALIIWNLVVASDAMAQSGAALSTTTTSAHRKSNQSKVFYYDNKWWAVAFHETRGEWFFWQYDGAAWIRKNTIQTGVNNWADVVVDSTTGKLYIYTSRQSQPRFRRYSYSAGAWVKDAGFPVTLGGFQNTDNNNPVSLVKAKNGHLWVFRIENGKLQTRYSLDDGATWQPVITIKDSLNQTKGTTEAVAFSQGGNDYVGVLYGEAGAANSRFGFHYHRDDLVATAWSNQSSALTFFGGERGNNELSAATDDSSNLYLLVRTFGGGPAHPRNTLYKRDTAGHWKRFIVNTVASNVRWSAPAAAIDQENRKIMVMGVNTVTGKGEYKTCRMGEEHLLASAPLQELFVSGADVFQNLSAPTGRFDASTGLMFTAGDTTTDDTWFRAFPIPANVPVAVQSVALSDNKVNANAQYTFVIRTIGCGGLTSGLGTIALRFPDNTLVPAAINAANILVDGTPASVVSSNAAAREIKITTPVAVAEEDTITVTVTTAAGLLNPSLTGSYTVEVWTSSQPQLAPSPSFTLINTTTIVSNVKAKVLPTDADSLAQYTVGFRVGACGRMKSGVSTFEVCFDPKARVTQGALSGVLVNGVSATAAGDSTNDKITITLPANIAVSNSDSVTLVIPRLAVRNPKYPMTADLEVATSVETAKIASNGFYHQRGRGVAATTKKFDRANQNKLFHHGGSWWMTAQDKATNKWHLWKRTDTTWTKSTEFFPEGKIRPDCVLDAVNNRVYILLPGSSITYLTRMTYANGAWTVDGGYHKQIVAAQDETMNLVRAKNNQLWVFWISDSTLYGVRSSNEGATWTAPITVKNNLTSDRGLTDAVAYTISGIKYLGLGYAEDKEVGSIFGFLWHKDGDPDATWTPEALPQFAGTNSDIHLSMQVYNGEVLMVVKTAGGGGSLTTKNGLFRRTSAGVWSAHTIIYNNGWTRPGLAIDSTNKKLYVFGTREGDLQTMEMKKVNLTTGGYNNLANAKLDTLMQNGNDDFLDVSTPAHIVGAPTGLLVAASNETRNEVWAQFIALGNNVAKPEAAPLSEATTAASNLLGEELEVSAYPNPFNPSTRIEFKLHAPAQVKLQIFNLNGQLVKTLVNGRLPGGSHQRTWRGANHEGEHVASGTYLYRLQVDGKMKTGRLFLLK
jgi:hypothetical protein